MSGVGDRCSGRRCGVVYGTAAPALMSSCGWPRCARTDVAALLSCRATGTELPATLIFDYPTIESLAALVASMHPESSVDESLGVVSSKTMDAPAPLVVNPRAPTLTRPGFFVVPPLRRLQSLPDAELAAMSGVVIGLDGVGEIAFLKPVNLLDADLDAIVALERGRISLYAPAPGSRPAEKPPHGSGLNQPAMLTFRRMTVRRPNDRREVEAFRGRLMEASLRLGGTFVHYDPEDGVWMVKVDRF